jgi:hypothetical protein
VKTKPTKTKAGTSKSEAVAPNDHSFNGFRVAMTERGRGLVAFVLQQLAALEEHDAHVGGSTKRTRARRSADQRRYLCSWRSSSSELPRCPFMTACSSLHSMPRPPSLQC